MRKIKVENANQRNNVFDAYCSSQQACSVGFICCLGKSKSGQEHIDCESLDEEKKACQYGPEIFEPYTVVKPECNHDQPCQEKNKICCIETHEPNKGIYKVKCIDSKSQCPTGFGKILIFQKKTHPY